MAIWQVRQELTDLHPVREIEADSIGYTPDKKLAYFATVDGDNVALIAMEPGMMVSRKQDG